MGIILWSSLINYIEWDIITIRNRGLCRHDPRRKGSSHQQLCDVPGTSASSFVSRWKMVDLPIISGWWFQPLWKILVSWNYYSQYMEKCSKPPTRYNMIYIYIDMTLVWLSSISPKKHVDFMNNNWTWPKKNEGWNRQENRVPKCCFEWRLQHGAQLEEGGWNHKNMGVTLQ